MSKSDDPTKPVSNAEKFKPQNVADEGAGQPGTSGRAERNMKDTPRGSKAETLKSSLNRSS